MTQDTTFILVPGAGGAAIYWKYLVPHLEAAGFEAIAVELPGADDTKGLEDYCDLIVERIGDRKDVVLVAQSLGGFTAPLVASRVRAVHGIVFVNAMIPNPNETSGAWWGNTGSEEARAEAAKRGGYSPKFDLHVYFLHDVPEDIAREVEGDARPQTKKIFGDRAAFERWPEVPIRVLIGEDDRFFPHDFQHRVARERLGDAASIVDVPGGHLTALSHPKELAGELIAFARQLQRSGTPGG